jgi:hypothetical protein
LRFFSLNELSQKHTSIVITIYLHSLAVRCHQFLVSRCYTSKVTLIRKKVSLENRGSPRLGPPSKIRLQGGIYVRYKKLYTRGSAPLQGPSVTGKLITWESSEALERQLHGSTKEEEGKLFTNKLGRFFDLQSLFQAYNQRPWHRAYQNYEIVQRNLQKFNIYQRSNSKERWLVDTPIIGQCP